MSSKDNINRFTASSIRYNLLWILIFDNNFTSGNRQNFLKLELKSYLKCKVSLPTVSIDEVEIALMRLPENAGSDLHQTKYFGKYVAMTSFIIRFINCKNIFTLPIPY